jgi:hypothetical protein
MKFSVDEKEIYESYDNLTGDWLKLELFVEKICDNGMDDETDVERFIDEAHKLSDSVDRLSEEVLRLPDDIK